MSSGRSDEAASLRPREALRVRLRDLDVELPRAVRCRAPRDVGEQGAPEAAAAPLRQDADLDPRDAGRAVPPDDDVTGRDRVAGLEPDDPLSRAGLALPVAVRLDRSRALCVDGGRDSDEAVEPVALADAHDLHQRPGTLGSETTPRRARIASASEPCATAAPAAASAWRASAAS